MAVMANQACMVFDFFLGSLPGILRQPLHLARERETFWYLFVYVRLMVLELASLEKKKKQKKEEERK